MEQSTAAIILFCILAIGIVAWAVTLILWQKMRRPEPINSTADLGPISIEQAKATLLRHVQPASAVTSSTDRRVVVRHAGCEGTFAIEPKDDTTRLHFQLSSRGIDMWLIVSMGIWILAVIPIAFVGISWLLWDWAVTSSVPVDRAQVFQMIHIVHFLWPAFALYYVHLTFQRVLTRTLPIIGTTLENAAKEEACPKLAGHAQA
ncbi:MAG: hypothetical protein AAF497_13935 [Planctomycetota bacterium]